MFNITPLLCDHSNITVSCRVSKITEDILFEQQENCDSTDDNEEGAKIFKMLEHAAEPEFILADMTPEQLKLFSSYIEKRNVSSSGICWFIFTWKVPHAESIYCRLLSKTKYLRRLRRPLNLLALVQGMLHHF